MLHFKGAGEVFSLFFFLLPKKFRKMQTKEDKNLRVDNTRCTSGEETIFSMLQFWGKEMGQERWINGS